MELHTLTRDAIQNEIVHILTDITQDWDLDLSDGISGSTRLMADTRLRVNGHRHAHRRHRGAVQP